jgi:hypothetical protein
VGVVGAASRCSEAGVAVSLPNELQATTMLVPKRAANRARMMME